MRVARFSESEALAEARRVQASCGDEGRDRAYFYLATLYESLQKPVPQPLLTELGSIARGIQPAKYGSEQVFKKSLTTFARTVGDFPTPFELLDLRGAKIERIARLFNLSSPVDSRFYADYRCFVDMLPGPRTVIPAYLAKTLEAIDRALLPLDRLVLFGCATDFFRELGYSSTNCLADESFRFLDHYLEWLKKFVPNSRRFSDRGGSKIIKALIDTDSTKWLGPVAEVLSKPENVDVPGYAIAVFLKSGCAVSNQSILSAVEILRSNSSIAHNFDMVLEGRTEIGTLKPEASALDSAISSWMRVSRAFREELVESVRVTGVPLSASDFLLAVKLAQKSSPDPFRPANAADILMIILRSLALQSGKPRELLLSGGFNFLAAVDVDRLSPKAFGLFNGISVFTRSWGGANGRILAVKHCKELSRLVLETSERLKRENPSQPLTPAEIFNNFISDLNTVAEDPRCRSLEALQDFVFTD
jgi:hypothetical protein